MHEILGNYKSMWKGMAGDLEIGWKAAERMWSLGHKRFVKE
jgi:hypothetical protein